MGYWGYEATASDSALDYLAKVTEHLEKMWDEAKDYGQKMAIVYILTEAPVVDVTDYRGLKEKCAKYLQDYADLLQSERKEGYPTQEMVRFIQEIKYLRGLVSKLQTKQSTTLIEKLMVIK